MRVTTASRKKRSCETRMTACGYALRYSSSQLRASRSRWLVGSSSSSRFGWPSSSLASAMRICQPPENVSVGRSKSRGLEAEALQHRRGLQLDAVAVVQRGSDPADRCSGAASRRARPPGSTGRRAAPRARASRPSSPSSSPNALRRFLEDGAAGVGEAVLRQVADGQRRRLEDGARVGLVEPGHHPQQRGLAGAVRAAQADALAIGDLPRDVVEAGRGRRRTW